MRSRTAQDSVSQVTSQEQGPRETNPRQATAALRTARRLARRLVFPLLGLLSLAWFLARVIPKPSRAAYPCQQAAFPLATAFVLWVGGVAASARLGLSARTQWRRSRPLVAVLLVGLAGLVLLPTLALQSSSGRAAYYGLRNALLSPAPPLALRSRTGDLLTVEPAAVVGAAKALVPQAEDLDAAAIATLVNDAIARAGGFGSLIADGDTVVLKPNLIASRDFTAAGATLPAEVNGIATDHRVIQAVVDAVRDVNPNGEIYLVEGSGVGTTSINMSILKWDQVTGLDGLITLETTGVAWWDTTSAQLQGVSLPAGKALYTAANNRYWLDKLYYEADVLISLPVLKNHLATGVTGAVKNVGIGATPPKIYGLGPHYPNPYERSARINHGTSYSARTTLHDWIHDFYFCRPVDFTILDGLQGIENGPLCHEFLNGSQELADDQMNARLILAGHDPIAVDAIASLLCGHDPALVRHLVTLHNDSLGCADPRLIRVAGTKVGAEKQLYEIDDSGLQSQYTDLTPPSFTVDACYAVGDQLHLHLDVDAEVSKVEAAVDGVVLDQIRLGEFDHFAFDLGSTSVGLGTPVTVYAYDAYLNFSSRSWTVGTAADIVPQSGPGELRVWPTPGPGPAAIEFGLRRAGPVRLEVFGVDGRRVATLLDGAQPAGSHRVTWNAAGEAPGVYFVRLRTGAETVTRKFVKIE